MTSKHSIFFGALVALYALPWAGCGQTGGNACSGGDCAGAPSTGGCAGNGCTSAGAPANAGCGGATCGGAAGASTCTGGDCAGAAPVGGCAGDGCGGEPSDCSAGAGGCAAACVPGALSCAANKLLRCDAKGNEQLEQACASDERCDANAGACVANVCEPGSTTCDGGDVSVCNADGSGSTVTKNCSLTQVCQEGECRDIVCVPNSGFCVQKEVWSCSADGTAAELVKRCSSKQFCLEQDGAADCSATLCVPATAMCVGSVATECAADGSGALPGGDNCAALGQACYEGECRDLACVPGRKLCNHDDVYLCTENGTATQLFADCADATEFCDPTTGSCRTRVCTPGAKGCDGNRIATCDALGAGFEGSGSDCSETGAVCIAGSCKPLICSPNQYLCSQGNVYRCDSTGTASTLNQTCGSNTHCESLGATYAYCAYNPCTAGAPGCSGNIATTCKADGTGWETVGTDCAASGKVCQNGACVTQLCKSYEMFCSGKQVLQCSHDGLSSSVWRNCTGNSYCAQHDNVVECLRTPCNAGAAACVAERLGTCASDGMSLASVSADCSAQGKLCTLAGCAAQSVDTMGSGDQVRTPTEMVIGNEVLVQSARTLTQIEAYLSLPASRALTWVVYERLSDSYFSLVASAASTGTGTGFQSSGAISQLLQAGKTYFIGVGITGSYVAYYGTAGDQLTTFGPVLGSATSYTAQSTISVYVQPEQLYYFRVTTKLPQ
ncbi:MAG: hypothetical protein ACOY0T_35940 [Myxococcota bacterium]